MDDMNTELFRDDCVPDPCAPPGAPLSENSERASTMQVLQLEAPPSVSRSASGGVTDAV